MNELEEDRTMDMLSFQRTNPDGTIDNISLRQDIAENLLKEYPQKFRRLAEDVNPVEDKPEDNVSVTAEGTPKTNFIPKNKLFKKK